MILVVFTVESSILCNSQTPSVLLDCAPRAPNKGLKVVLSAVSSFDETVHLETGASEIVS